MAVHKKVCIIGAGVSGLRAAHKLLTTPGTPLKPSDVIILEASGRIGGRIKTDKTSSKFGRSYDLGAAWFHDALTNSVLHSSIKDGSFDVAKDGFFDDKAPKYYASEFSGEIDARNLKLEQVVHDIESFIELYYSESLDVADLSLTDIVKLYFERYDVFLTPQQKKLCGRMCRYFELWFGISSNNISAKYAVMHHQGRNLYNKKGYSFLIEKLQSSLECDILLNEQVKVIDRDVKHEDFKNLVKTAKGTEIGADFLVVTVPLSVLSLDANHEYGIQWQPALPQNMQLALENAHFGALGKVIFEFDHVWWDASQDTCEILPDSSEVEKYDGKSDIKSFSYPIYVVNYAVMHENAASLVILIQDPVTQYLEANPHMAWEYMKPMLVKIGTQKMEDPVNTIVTDWTQNPYARGSYGAVFVGDDPSEILINLSGEFDAGLGMDSSIRFAGEHTVVDGAGCVHGAYDSGERAADFILGKFGEKKEARSHI